MAIAGKVAITPKGDWNESITYEKLDFVFYNDNSYVALKPSTGIVPTNTEYWMLSLQGASKTEIEAIITGTQQVGNAKTLDGRGAEYFATKTDVSDLSNYLSEVDERLELLEYMTLQNDFTAPLIVEAGNTLLVDDLGFSIVADWKFKEE